MARKKVKRKKRKQSALVKKITGFFEEAIKVPVEGEEDETPEPVKKEPVKPKPKKLPKVKRSELPDLSKLKPPKSRVEVIETVDDGSRAEILDTLNTAAKRWKKTGDTGLKLSPHVSMHERVRKMLSRIKISPNFTSKLRKSVDDAVKKSSARLKKAEKSGKKVDTAKIVKEEWKAVVERLDSVNTKEREEIEKIYKQLEGREGHGD